MRKVILYFAFILVAALLAGLTMQACVKPAESTSDTTSSNSDAEFTLTGDTTP